MTRKIIMAKDKTPPPRLFEDDDDIHDREWQDMPEFTRRSKESFQIIFMHFANIDDLKKFAELIGQKIGPKTNSLWFPPQVNMESSKYRYVDADDPRIAKEEEEE